jgi:hypothetical protein
MAATRDVMPVSHERPAEGEAHELLGFGRELMWLRLVGVAIMVSQAPSYELLSPWIIVAVAILAVATAAAARLTIKPGVPLASMRRRAGLYAISDIVAIYLMGTAFVPDGMWTAFYYYPLMSLEATLIGGTMAGLVVTGTSVLVYLAQLSLHIALFNQVQLPEVISAVGMLGMTGGFMALSGGLAERGHRDLRVLLDVASALVNERDPVRAIEVLDRRIHSALGGRVRSIALRHPAGHFELLRWHATGRRRLEVDTVQTALGSALMLEQEFEAGRSLTYQTDAWSVVTSALGLPEWTRGVTLVPVNLEGRWMGVLPVLWAAPRTPTRHELRLLYGIANQVGPALAQAGIWPLAGPPAPAFDATEDADATPVERVAREGAHAPVGT